MSNINKTVDFYMGANSPDGFCTYYNELTIPVKDTRSYLIKGGAGTGKSSLIKRVVAECARPDELIELIHCSSDPNSLDGAILTEKKISIVDATPPHVIEPQYPGGYQTVINLCEYFNNDMLNDRLEKTVEYQTKNNDCHKKCCKLLRCANLLLDDNKTLVRTYTDLNKVAVLASRIVKNELKKQSSIGVEHKRLLSAITNQGIKVFDETVKTLAERVYLIKDDYGVASGELLMKIRDAAVSLGYSIYVCYCPLNQSTQVEHIFIPSIGLAFVTANSFVPFDVNKLNPYSVISYVRFTKMEKLKEHKRFLAFNKSMATKLINSAVSTLKLAKVIHDDLELQYTSAVDFAAVTKKGDEIVQEIKNKI